MALNITPPPVDTPTIGADGKATAVWQKWLQILAARLKLVVDLDSAQTLTNKTLTPSTWTTLPTNNSWVTRPSPYPPIGYRKLPDGTVEVRGSLRNGTTVSGTIVATLPAGFRPVGATIFTGWSSGSVVPLVVTDDGAITAYSGTGAINSGEITLDAIRFPTT